MSGCGVHEIPETWTSCPFCERVQERVFVEQIVKRSKARHKDDLSRMFYVAPGDTTSLNERHLLYTHESELKRYAMNFGHGLGRRFPRGHDAGCARTRKWAKIRAWNWWYAAADGSKGET